MGAVENPALSQCFINSGIRARASGLSSDRRILSIQNEARPLWPVFPLPPELVTPGPYQDWIMLLVTEKRARVADFNKGRAAPLLPVQLRLDRGKGMRVARQLAARDDDPPLLRRNRLGRFRDAVDHTEQHVALAVSACL